MLLFAMIELLNFESITSFTLAQFIKQCCIVALRGETELEVELYTYNKIKPSLLRAFTKIKDDYCSVTRR